MTCYPLPTSSSCVRHLKSSFTQSPIARICGGLALSVTLAGCDALSLLSPPKPMPVPEQGIVLQDVVVVNPGVSRQLHVDLTVTGAEITNIAPSEQDAKTTLADPRYVLPGLIDMHHHLPSPLPGLEDLGSVLNLMHGVTTVRVVGATGGRAKAYRERILAEDTPGPRVFRCGPILDGKHKSTSNSRPLASPEEAREVALALVDDGVDCFKVYENLNTQTLAVLLDIARENNLPVLGHVPQSVTLADSGIDDVQHLTGVIEQPLVAESRFTGSMASAILNILEFENADQSVFDEAVSVSLQENMSHTPTLVTYQQFALLAGGPEEVLKKTPALRYYPKAFSRMLAGAIGTKEFQAISDDQWEKVDRGLANMFAAVTELHEAGIPLHAGTDARPLLIPPGWSVQQELRNFVTAGMSPEEAWASVSRRAAQTLRASNLGMLQPGAAADFLVFSEDPTQSLDALATLELVVVDGRPYPIEDLKQQASEYQAYYNSPEYTSGTDMLMSLYSKIAR